MPRSKEKKRRPGPLKVNVENAVREVINSNLSIRAAASQFGIAKSALARHIEIFKKSGQNDFVYNSNYKVKQVFNEAEETELVNYLKTAARMHYGLSLANVKKLAYEYAMQNKKKYPTQWDEKKEAGDNWLRGFRSRHSAFLSLRKPEGTSLARATAFNKETVAAFFQSYKNALAKGNFEPSKIFNVDETGITTVQKPPKILAPKGQKQIGGMTSGERGVLVTMICCINAAGNTVPPLFVFPRVNFKSHMLKVAPPGAIGAANQSGWSNEEIFFKFLEHFISHVKPTLEDKVILLLDNHESHVSIPTINLAKRSGVILVTFHPHTSHRLQPLDLSVFGPFKTYYNNAMTNWMSSPGNAGKPVTIYDVAELANTAYLKAFCPNNIIKGFQVSGIYPLNTDIFTEQDFLPSYVTNREDPQSHNPPPTLSSDPNPSFCDASEIDPKPSGSGLNSSSSPEAKSVFQEIIPVMSNIISPYEVCPIPKAPPRKGNASRGRKKGRARILTDTPELNEIKEDKTKAMEKKRKKELQRTKTVKRKLNIEETSSEEDQIDFEIRSDSSYSDDASLSEVEIDSIQFTPDDLQEGNFILVHLKGKKQSGYFVATISGKVDETEFQVKYLKKAYSSTYGYTFTVEDEVEYTTNISDIVQKLPQPRKAGSSSRLSNTFIFPVSFAKINLG